MESNNSLLNFLNKRLENPCDALNIKYSAQVSYKNKANAYERRFEAVLNDVKYQNIAAKIPLRSVAKDKMGKVLSEKESVSESHVCGEKKIEGGETVKGKLIVNDSSEDGNTEGAGKIKIVTEELKLDYKGLKLKKKELNQEILELFSKLGIKEEDIASFDLSDPALLTEFAIVLSQLTELLNRIAENKKYENACEKTLEILFELPLSNESQKTGSQTSSNQGIIEILDVLKLKFIELRNLIALCHLAEKAESQESGDVVFARQAGKRPEMVFQLKNRDIVKTDQANNPEKSLEKYLGLEPCSKEYENEVLLADVLKKMFKDVLNDPASVTGQEEEGSISIGDFITKLFTEVKKIYAQSKEDAFDNFMQKKTISPEKLEAAIVANSKKADGGEEISEDLDSKGSGNKNDYFSPKENPSLELLLKDIKGFSEHAAQTLKTGSLQPSSLTTLQRMPSYSSHPFQIERSVMDQITGRFYMAISKNFSEIKMVLKPEHLGQVRLSVEVEGKIIFAKLQVENEIVKHIVENNSEQLKDSLEDKGIKIQGFEVSVNRGDKEDFFKEGGMEYSANFNWNRLIMDEVKTAHDHEIYALGADTGRRYGYNTVEVYA